MSAGFFDPTAIDAGWLDETAQAAGWFGPEGLEAADSYTLSVAEQEQPTGGWAAFNYAQIDRNRRKRRELEEEADRLEMALAAEGLVKPDPVVEHRYTVTEYKHLAPTFNRRTQRAIDYAERARTALAYELAAKAIAQAIEDDEMALLMAVALVA